MGLIVLLRYCNASCDRDSRKVLRALLPALATAVCRGRELVSCVACARHQRTVFGVDASCIRGDSTAVHAAVGALGLPQGPGAMVKGGVWRPLCCERKACS